MVESTHNTLPYPPQMRNGGSLPAHLSSSSLSDPSWWLQFKWSQPPPRAPKWLFDYYRSYNPPANVGRPPPYKEWLQRAIHEDQEAAGLLPLEQPYWGPLLRGMVQAWVGQKLVKSNIFTSFFYIGHKLGLFHLSDAFYKSSIILLT
jgi:hypothetical protein